ncbi:uncharacterized protein LOC122306347 [Carya illinoinensis]|uniref:uncharacterized protein LOC122306347 n=1 Tax=Carya illinoinensis TaxID=32201 RepID=UPI001C720644|nr:uncharacterized protein LOC122306347 [Carya illinoinensis]
MKHLSWNCRGLGNPRAVHDLCLLVREKKPNLVFLIETKLRTSKFDSIKRKLGFDCCFAVEPLRKKGGLAMLWKKEYAVELVNYSQHHIHMLVTEEEDQQQWFCTGFYGHPETSKRSSTWNLLSMIRPSFNQAWCVMGDFNEILASNEKWGGRQRPKKQMEEFRHAVHCNNLHDLGWKGSLFTWRNRQQGLYYTKERLDRVIANPPWINMFKRLAVETLATRRSDHRPILLTCYRTGFPTMVKSYKFMFEAKWTKDVEGEDVVRKEWRRVTCGQDGWGQIKEKLKACAQVLTRWNKGKKVDCEKEILDKTEELRKLQDV